MGVLLGAREALRGLPRLNSTFLKMLASNVASPKKGLVRVTWFPFQALMIPVIRLLLVRVARIEFAGVGGVTSESRAKDLN